MEDIIGKPAAVFIAPAWLYGPGAMDALRGSGFALAEDHMKVWRPDNGEVLAPLPTVRVAVHPGDVAKSSILASIDRTLAAFVASRSAD